MEISLLESGEGGQDRGTGARENRWKERCMGGERKEGRKWDSQGGWNWEKLRKICNLYIFHNIL